MKKEQNKTQLLLVNKLNDFLKENNITIETKIDFPQYRQFPDDVNLALKVIENHKGKIIIFIKENNNQNEK